MREKPAPIVIGKEPHGPVVVRITSGKNSTKKVSVVKVYYIEHPEVLDTVSGAIRSVLQKRGLA